MAFTITLYSGLLGALLYKQGRDIQTNLKTVLCLYLIGLLLRLLVQGVLIAINFYQEVTTLGLILLSAQVIIYKIPIFLFLYILFKMKRIEIMLDYN